MSSPTYDEQVDLSQEDIEAFDKIEHALSQLHSQSQLQVRSSSQSQSGMTQPSPSKKGKRLSQSTSLSAKEKRQREIAEALIGVNYHARAGKENLYATDGGRAKKAAPISPSKDIASSQPRFELAQGGVSHSSAHRDSLIPKPRDRGKIETMRKQSEAPLLPFWLEDRGLSVFLGFLVLITIFVPMVRLSRVGRIEIDLIFALMLFSGAIATIRNRVLMYLVVAFVCYRGKIVCNRLVIQEICKE